MVLHNVMRCLTLFGTFVFGQSFQCLPAFEGKPPVHTPQLQLRTGGSDQITQKRIPTNKRQAIKWVVQGVERCLSEQQLSSPPNSSSIRFRKNNEERIYTYKRREDASLVDALYLLVNAKSQKEVINAGKRIEVLTRVGRGRQDFSQEVTERVIKATASTGLVALSLDLLKRLLDSEHAFPSSMAYTAVLNALRKNGRVVQMEDLLTELGSSCRRINNLQLKSDGDSTKLAKAGVGVDIVAFNSFIAALCDAAVKEILYSSSSSDRVNTDVENFDGKFFNDNNSTEVTSPSEKYLYKALNLLKGDTARTRFELLEDPNIYSYNSLLAAIAKCSRSTASKDLSEYVTLILRGMKQRGIKADAFTYNARIEVALQAESSKKDIQKESEVIGLIDEAVSLVEIDRYTVNLALIPFLRSGRRCELISMLESFYKSKSDDSKLVSSAFEAFLNTLVQNSEVDFAREIFEVFFLPSRQKTNRIQMSREIRVVRKQSGSMWPDEMAGDIKKNYVTAPTTRHFNILFGGYSKEYLSLTSRRKPDPSADNESDIPEDTAASIAQEAYGLLDSMLKMRLPLDEFTVSSLMVFPSSSDDITLLWKRVELELRAELSPVAYRSIIYAYGNAKDTSSACWVFIEMATVCGRRGMSVDSWNVLLGALAQGCTGDDDQILLNPLNSTAAHRHGERRMSGAESNQIISLMHGKTCAEASMCILDAMRNRSSFLAGSRALPAPKPNSQTYCQVATAQSASGTRESNPAMANKLFHFAKEDGAYVDGRFLNAVLRCYGGDIDSALKAWKSGLGSAAAGVGVISGPSKERSTLKQAANLASAYNGLMHVCGRAMRPDVALRLCYAMTKTGVEPNEVSLNSYFAGNRVAENGKYNNGRLDLKNQFESLLTVECTKYSAKDKRRATDKKIRIILS